MRMGWGCPDQLRMWIIAQESGRGAWTVPFAQVLTSPVQAPPSNTRAGRITSAGSPLIRISRSNPPGLGPSVKKMTSCETACSASPRRRRRLACVASGTFLGRYQDKLTGADCLPRQSALGQTSLPPVPIHVGFCSCFPSRAGGNPAVGVKAGPGS